MRAHLPICAMVAGTVLVVAPASSHAQGAAKWKFCDGKGLGTPDVRIRNCTVLIRSRVESKLDRAIDYNNRGLAYDNKGDLDRAIADYNDAILLDLGRIRHCASRRGATDECLCCACALYRPHCGRGT